MSDLVNKGSFDYPMELRITTFSDSKAQQMIWQEDQKTKMRRIDSKSLNQNDFATRICNQINADKQSNLCGLISRNKGVINAAYFCNIVQMLYVTQVKNRGDEIKIKNESTVTAEARAQVRNNNVERANINVNEKQFKDNI